MRTVSFREGNHIQHIWFFSVFLGARRFRSLFFCLYKLEVQENDQPNACQAEETTNFSSIGSFGMKKDTCFLRGPEVNMICVFISFGTHPWLMGPWSIAPFRHFYLRRTLFIPGQVGWNVAWTKSSSKEEVMFLVQNSYSIHIKIQRYFCLTSRLSSDLVFRCWTDESWETRWVY